MTSIFKNDFWFPERFIGGISLIVAPLLLLIGILLRVQFNFFFPDQLKAYSEHEALITASYSCISLAYVLLCFAVLTISKIIGKQKPFWAWISGTIVILGLFARIFHAGADYMAFQMVKEIGSESAQNIVANSYGSFHIFRTFNLSILFGWVLLALSSYISKTLNMISSICLLLMASMPLGVLKGTTTFSIIASIGLCIAFIPLGFRVIKSGNKNSVVKIISISIAVIIAIIVSYIFGELG